MGGTGDEKTAQASYLPAEAMQAGLARGKFPVYEADRTTCRRRHLSARSTLSSLPPPCLDFFLSSIHSFLHSIFQPVGYNDKLCILTLGFAILFQ